MPSTDRSLQEDSLEGYSGKALELLRKSHASVGSKVIVKSNDGMETTGLLIPRYQQADQDHIVIKLKSGYNIGLDVTSIVSVSVLERPRPVAKPSNSRVPSETGKLVLLLSTGGTIASRVDYRTGSVRPALSAEDLYAAVPELNEISEIDPRVVFSTYSENLNPEHWQTLAEYIADSLKEVKRRIDGIVVMLGTDTLAYVSAALSFALIGVHVPIVCVGSQRSSDRPSSDSTLNLKAAVRFAANANSSGVFVAMHKSENDESIAIHRGTRVRKNHTSRRDAFKSIDAALFAEVRNEKIFFLEQDPGQGTLGSDKSLNLKTKFEKKVALLKFYPGFDQGLLAHLESIKIKGIVVEGTGLGHVSSETIKTLEGMAKRGIFIGMASQCTWGRVDLNVYETGRDLIKAGVVPLDNMLGETAYAKLSWAFGNFADEDIKKIMLSNVAQETTLRSTL